MKKLFLLVLIPLFLFGKTTLWKISKGANVLYLGGTIHLLRSSDFPLPPEFDSAYIHSDKLVFETDLGVLNDAGFNAELMKMVSFPAGESLKDVLRPEVYEKISAEFQERGISMDAVDRFRPAMVSLLLGEPMLKKSELASEGVDLFYYNRCKKDNRPIGTLETPQEQIRYIASMGDSDPDGLLLSSLEEASESEDIIETMIVSWKNGDEKQLDDLVVKDLKNEFPAVYESLFVERNENWLPQIRKMADSAGTEFVLVGAGHLVGDKGILSSLKKAGYSVKPAHFAPTPKKSAPKKTASKSAEPTKK